MAAREREAAWSPEPVDERLSYWSAPHPGWTPASAGPTGWPERVTSAVVDVPGAPLVLIDPLAPRGNPAFWAWLEARRRARGGLAILLSNRYHGRSAPDILARWPDTPVYGHALTDGHATVPVTHTLSDGEPGPAGTQAVAIAGLDDGELAWRIPASSALFIADAALGRADGTLRLAPPSWLRDSSLYDSIFRPAVERALLGASVILVSHGDGVAKLTFGGKSPELEASGGASSTAGGSST